MEAFIKRHSIFWKDNTIIKHVLLSITLLVVSLFLIYFARIYTSDYTDNVVPDLLLDHLPVINVGYVFFQGAFLFLLSILGILLWNPKYIPFVLESSALFFFARSFFMVMTHLSAPATEYYKYVEHEHHVTDVLFTVSSGNDLFFSGHTGFPFLLALVFWHYKPFRFIFLTCSLIGGIAVLLGHLHYSIDVFSSFFIAFGIAEASKYLFRKEFNLLKS
jgi:membrane-associated phospholipid phosphatase